MSPGNGLMLFKKECKQNNLTTLMDLLEYYNKLDVKLFLQALFNQRETFYEFNIDIFKDFFTVSSIAKHMLARISEMFYQRIDGGPKDLSLPNPEVASIKIDREYIETKIKIYSDNDRKERRRSIPLTINNIVDIINREHQICYYCKIALSGGHTDRECRVTLDRLNNNIGHQASNCVLCCISCNKAKSN